MCIRDRDTGFLTDFFEDSEVKINIIDLLEINGKTVSSTEIRKFFEKGDIDNIKLFMGRYPSISGKVVRGFNRGSRIGFPTANIELDENYMIPKKGVYFARIKIRGYRKALSCIVNIGNNPTFGLRELLLEAHIIGFGEEIYTDMAFHCYRPHKHSCSGFSTFCKRKELNQGRLHQDSNV